MSAHRNYPRRAAVNAAPRLPADFLGRIDRAGYAQQMDESVPDDGLVAFSTVRDIEGAYAFTKDSTTQDKYLCRADTGDPALFHMVGVAVETRLPPVHEEKWNKIMEYPASAVQCIRLWGCGSGVFGDLLNGVDNIHKYACEDQDMEPLDIIAEYSSFNPSIDFGPTIKLSRRLLSESGSSEPRTCIDDPKDLLGAVEGKTGMRHTIANKIAAFDRRMAPDNQG